MAQRFTSGRFQFANSAGVPYAGGSLEFYGAGGSTPQSVYSNSDLVTGPSTTVTLNSAGWPDNDIYLQNLPYKIILKDASGNQIWVDDNYHPTDFSSVMVTKVGSGNPNGVVAGTAGSSGVLATAYWDYTNAVEYRCTTTGTASTAVWTALNAEAATPAVPPPQGYLTPTSGTPIILSDSSAATALYYTPFVGNLVPIYNLARFVPTEFSELTLTLSASHLASQIYDVFVFSNEGVLTLVTGPAWTTPTAGAGARGTGAGTTQIERLNGYWVNTVQITGRNGSTTYTIAAQTATYLGSIFMDGTNGQLTCHRAWGASRKWGIWNAYNRQPLYLQAGDSTASWTYETNTIRASRDQSTNSLTVFQGLPEEFYDLRFAQTAECVPGSGNESQVHNLIGWNSTTAASGRKGNLGLANVVSNDGSATIYGNMIAEFFQVPSIGINVVTALEQAPQTEGTSTWYGGEDDMVLSARWRG